MSHWMNKSIKKVLGFDIQGLFLTKSREPVYFTETV